jgi:hypothetical protein
MHWDKLKKRMEIAKENWERMKTDLGQDPQSMEFLSRCYLVLANRCVQVTIDEFDHGLSSMIQEKPELLKHTEANQEFIGLCKKIKNLEKQYQRLRYGQNHLLSTIERVKSRLHEFELHSLDFADDLHVEVRFPTVRMELIQKVKQHPLVDSSRTPLSEASIRVVISSERTGK